MESPKILPAVEYVGINHPDITQFIKNKNKAAANYSHDMRDRLEVLYESNDGTSKTYVIESPCNCERTVEAVKDVLGGIVNIHRRDYTITELIVRGNPDRMYHKGDLIEFKVKPFMANRKRV